MTLTKDTLSSKPSTFEELIHNLKKTKEVNIQCTNGINIITYKDTLNEYCIHRLLAFYDNVSEPFVQNYYYNEQKMIQDIAKIKKKVWSPRRVQDTY